VLHLTRPLHPAAESRFRETYEAHRAALHRYLVRLAGDASLAEDVTQELFVRLWKEMTTAGEPANVRPWLYRVATNLVIDHGHRRRRTLAFILPSAFATPDAPSRDPDVERDVARRQLVRRALDRLPEPMRQCLLLHHEGLTGKEIALVLGVKPSYVGTLVLRAHDRFRRECAALGGPDGLLG
jgi:RNA polymerase sigma-70 factor (ECF subfamily)